MPKANRPRGRRKSRDILEKKKSEPSGLIAHKCCPMPPIPSDAAKKAQLLPDELKYFLQARATLERKGFLDLDDLSIFVENVFDEAQGKELALIENYQTAPLIEALIGRASAARLIQMYKALEGHFASLARSKFGSFTIEKLLRATGQIIDREHKTESTHLEGLQDDVYVSVDTIMEYICNVYHELVSDDFGAHVLQTLALVISGVQDGDSSERLYVPEHLLDVRRNLFDCLIKLNPTTLRCLCFNAHACTLLQTVVKLDSDFCDHLTQHILGEDHKDFMEGLIRDPVGSRLVETLLSNSPELVTKTIWEGYLRGKTAKFARHPIVTFVLQRLLTACLDSSICLEIKSELSGLVEGFISSARRCGTIVHEGRLTPSQGISLCSALISACSRLDLSVVDITDSVLKAIRADQQSFDMLWPETLALGHIYKKSDSEVESDPIVTKSGVDLARLLMESSPENAGHYFKSLISQPSAKVLAYAQNLFSSYIIESVIRGDLPMMMDKGMRQRLLNHLLSGSIEDLVKNKASSHIIEASWLFTAGLPHYRAQFAQAIASTPEIKFDVYGKRVWRTWHLDAYLHKPNEWRRQVREDKEKLAAVMGRRLVEQRPQQPSTPRVEGAVAHHAKPSSRRKAAKHGPSVVTVAAIAAELDRERKLKGSTSRLVT